MWLRRQKFFGTEVAWNDLGAVASSRRRMPRDPTLECSRPGLGERGVNHHACWRPLTFLRCPRASAGVDTPVSVGGARQLLPWPRAYASVGYSAWLARRFHAQSRRSRARRRAADMSSMLSLRS